MWTCITGPDSCVYTCVVGGKVDDILGEESDNDSEGKEKERRVEGEEEDEETSRQSAESADYHTAVVAPVKDSTSTAKEESSLTGCIVRYLS